MGFKRIDVRVTDSTLSSLKKRAVSEGKSASGIARLLIETGLENRLEKVGGGEGDVLEGTPSGRPRREIDADKIRDAVSEAVREVLSPELLRYLVQDTAKTENLLRQISLLISEKEPGSRAKNFEVHAERVRNAKQKADRILKKLSLEGIGDADEDEKPRELTKEETEEMLRREGLL